MSKHLFEVRPVASYDAPRYPTGHEIRSGEEPLEERHHPLAVLLAVLLALGLSVGLLACYGRSGYVGDPPTPDGGGDGGGDGDPPPPDCEIGDVRCFDATAVEFCEDDGWAREDCHARCVELLGPEAYSRGCDETAPEPCQCEYGMIDGAAPICTPGDVYCEDDRTLVTCEDYDLRTVDCNVYCNETYGPDYYSLGCDASAEDPCQCQYGIVDGEAPACLPGELLCLDAETLGVCNDDGWSYSEVDCDVRCLELYGPSFASAGCDASAAEPCLCEESGFSGDPD